MFCSGLYRIILSFSLCVCVRGMLSLQLFHEVIYCHKLDAQLISTKDSFIFHGPERKAGSQAKIIHFEPFFSSSVNSCLFTFIQTLDFRTFFS